jgi:hypothetical protein
MKLFCWRVSHFEERASSWGLADPYAKVDKPFLKSDTQDYPIHARNDHSESA